MDGCWLSCLERKHCSLCLFRRVRERVHPGRRKACFDGEFYVKSIKLGFVSRRFSHTMSDYERAQKRITNSETGDVLHTSSVRDS